MPFYFRLPIPEVREFKRLQGLLMGTVDRIIAQKRYLVEKGDGMPGNIFISLYVPYKTDSTTGVLGVKLYTHRHASAVSFLRHGSD